MLIDLHFFTMGLKRLISRFEFNFVLQHKKNFGMVFI